MIAIMIRGPQVWPESFNKWGDEVSANVGGSGADFGNGTDCDRSPLFRATTPLLRVVVHLRDTCWTQVIDTTHTHTHIQNETEKKQKKKKKKRWWRRRRASERERERKEKKALGHFTVSFPASIVAIRTWSSFARGPQKGRKRWHTQESTMKGRSA